MSYTLSILAPYYLFNNNKSTNKQKVNVTIRTRPWVSTLLVTALQGRGGRYELPMFFFYRRHTCAKEIQGKYLNLTLGSKKPWLRIHGDIDWIRIRSLRRKTGPDS